jgi:NADPH:quinone reductase-like Zn-dependent oxidoreductase
MKNFHQALFILLEINAPFASPYQFIETFQNSPSILVYSGATSVGLFTIGLARNLRTRGGHPYRIFATASPKNHNKLLALGVEAVYDHRSPTWPEELRKASGGISYAVDCLSEGDSTALISHTFVEDGGKIAVVRTTTWRKEGIRPNVIPLFGAAMSGLNKVVHYNGKAASRSHSKFTNHSLIQVTFFLHGDRSRLRFTNICLLALPKILQSFQFHRIRFASCLVALNG